MAGTINVNGVDVPAARVITVQLPGMPGPQGELGPANTLTVGSVTKGVNPSATITGVAPNQVLSLVLPQGNQGIQGIQGPKGDQGVPGPQGVQGIQGIQGPQGLTGTNGKDGAGVSVAGQVATYANLPTNLTSADAGKAWLNSADGKLYVWSGTAFPTNGNGATFVGPAGPANTLTMGTVTTGASGSAASATLTGTAPNQVLSLTIPTASGVPAAGATGTVLMKKTAADYDTQWSVPTNLATPNSLVLRDGSGSVAFAWATLPNAPAAGTDATNKDYVDTVVANAAAHPSPVWNSPSTGASSNNLWFKVATITATSQFVEANSSLLFNAIGSGSSTEPQARVQWRVKQQNALGGVPSCSLWISDIVTPSTIVTASSFMYIIEQNTATSTVVSLWVFAAETFTQFWAFEEVGRTSGATLVYAPSNAPGVATASLPAGTQTFGALAPVDAKVATHDTTLNAATKSATASTLMLRDAAGRAQVVDPSVAADIATKNYVDTGLSAIPKIYVQTATPTGTIPDGSLWFKG